MATTQNSRPKGLTEGRKQDHSHESTCRRARRKSQNGNPSPRHAEAQTGRDPYI